MGFKSYFRVFFQPELSGQYISNNKKLKMLESNSKEDKTKKK